MSQYYRDPYRGRRLSQRQAQGTIMADYQKVVRAYQQLSEQNAQLESEIERQGKELAEAQKQLQIKSEAIKRQKEELQKLDAELLFTQAALKQQDESEADRSTADDTEWADKYARLQAEMENLRKRWEQRFAVESTEARHRILRDMLPLADHLEMALNHAESEDAEINGSFVDNIVATQRAFLDTLKRYNVTPIDAKGQPFDPNLHEAVGQVASEEVPEGVVAEVTQTGYQEGDKLLRPSRVLVSAGSMA